MNPRLSKQDIVDRAERRRRLRADRLLILLWCSGMLGVLAGFAFVLYDPIHGWLQAHRQFLWGLLVGSLLQVPGWLRDRWRWMKWFSL